MSCEYCARAKRTSDEAFEGLRRLYERRLLAEEDPGEREDFAAVVAWCGRRIDAPPGPCRYERSQRRANHAGQDEAVG